MVWHFLAVRCLLADLMVSHEARQSRLCGDRPFEGLGGPERIHLALHVTTRCCARLWKAIQGSLRYLAMSNVTLSVSGPAQYRAHFNRREGSDQRAVEQLRVIKGAMGLPRRD